MTYTKSYFKVNDITSLPTFTFFYMYITTFDVSLSKKKKKLLTWYFGILCTLLYSHSIKPIVPTNPCFIFLNNLDCLAIECTTWGSGDSLCH